MVVGSSLQIPHGKGSPCSARGSLVCPPVGSGCTGSRRSSRASQPTRIFLSPLPRVLLWKYLLPYREFITFLPPSYALGYFRTFIFCSSFPSTYWFLVHLTCRDFLDLQGPKYISSFFSDLPVPKPPQPKSQSLETSLNLSLLRSPLRK